MFCQALVFLRYQPASQHQWGGGWLPGISKSAWQNIAIFMICGAQLYLSSNQWMKCLELFFASVCFTTIVVIFFFITYVGLGKVLNSLRFAINEAVWLWAVATVFVTSFKVEAYGTYVASCHLPVTIFPQPKWTLDSFYIIKKCTFCNQIIIKSMSPYTLYVMQCTGHFKQV